MKKVGKRKQTRGDKGYLCEADPQSIVPICANAMGFYSLLIDQKQRINTMTILSYRIDCFRLDLLLYRNTIFSHWDEGEQLITDIFWIPNAIEMVLSCVSIFGDKW